mgnify:CR=1 FL=1
MKNKTKKIAVIRIRGRVGVRKEIKHTLELLRLYRKNYCVVLPATESILGMVKKVNSYVTWGEIDDETFKLLLEKRGEPYKGRITDSKGKIKYERKYLVLNKKKYKPYFRLNNPKGGFGRKGIKIPFSVGGGAGYRGEKINDLIRRML